jgi:amino acid transporter
MGFLFYIFYTVLSFLAALATVLFGRAAAHLWRKHPESEEGLWKSLKLVVALIIVPVAAVILMITMVGLPSDCLVWRYIAFIYLSHIFSTSHRRILVAITKTKKCRPTGHCC